MVRNFLEHFTADTVALLFRNVRIAQFFSVFLEILRRIGLELLRGFNLLVNLGDLTFIFTFFKIRGLEGLLF
jgi:hypothetical protein